jgi:hypothetical protein
VLQKANENPKKEKKRKNRNKKNKETKYFAINIKSQSHYDAKIFVLSSVGTHEWDRQ